MGNLVVIFAFCAATWAGLAQTPDAPVAQSQSSGNISESANLAKINIPGSSTFQPDLPVVSSPRLIKQPDPKFPKEARKEKLSGIVMLKMVVDEAGVPRDVGVVTGAGHGFDEAAIAAVEQWRFKPAIRDGKPVAVSMKAEVAFKLY